jgi:branched-chain amino acid transport system permease protein
MDASSLFQVAVWGLYAGCIYILLAIGLNLIFGVMKVVNFAHGEFLMLAAYITFWLNDYTGINPYYVIPVTMIILALVGVLVERLAFRPIRGTGKLNEIFLSLGLIYVFQNFAAFFWDTSQRSVHSPYAEVKIPFTDFPVDYLIIIIATGIILILFYLFMKKTDIGRAMRATSQNREAAQLMGVNVGRMDMLSFAIGSSLAAVAGSLWMISGQMANPFMGSIPAIKAFAVVIIGGLGSIPGAVFAGLLLGLSENLVPIILQFTASLAGYDISFNAWKDVIAFGLLIVVLVVKPTGLFGGKGE